jgi:hypothetical protein
MPEPLELMLSSIATEIDWPEPSTGFAARVVSRIEATPSPRPSRRLLPAFGVAAAIAALAVAFSPTSRDAVADFIGVGGVHIESVKPSTIPTAPPGSYLDLGRPVTLEEARASVDFHVLVPTTQGEPDAVYFERIEPANMVSLVYQGGTDDLEFLITEFEGRLAEGSYMKKLTASGTIVEPVQVNGSAGYWLSGDAHTFYYRTGDLVRPEVIRLVENVLLWVQNGVTMRIETRGSLNDALEIAESLR